MAKQCRSPKRADKWLEPTQISRDAWFYTESKGLRVVQESRTADGKHIATLQTLIPWFKVESALKRMKARVKK